jgi:hypothetical protein
VTLFSDIIFTVSIYRAPGVHSDCLRCPHKRPHAPRHSTLGNPSWRRTIEATTTLALHRRAPLDQQQAMIYDASGTNVR